MSHQIIVHTKKGGVTNADPAHLEIRQGDSLLAASERCMKKAISVGCRGGGCGICRVRILSGEYQYKPMSKAHISEDDKEQGIVLACRVYPTTDMEVVHEAYVKPALLQG